ncbi:hypothetical protein [Micromonospora sp. WMMD1082]|uniref:hypothetical protein n=1 Tax=Micromonospora sp. WMMD1082 TaxID=3016104 RepID=UPI002415B3AA|nr:hypothetical protein [Micromonospora sp. WMMD1082]MDG4793659.1 hypothetical protein [Micromonospora sp. WMMD1082]
MHTTKPIGTVPLPGLGSGITLTIYVEYDPQALTPSGPADPTTARRPATVALSVVGHVGGQLLDLGVRRPDVPAQGLPADLGVLAATEPVASLIGEFRDRLADLTVHLARLGVATGDGVAVAFTVDDLEFLRHCLTLTELRWREAIDGAETAAQQPQRDEPAPPGFMNIEPTPAGYRVAAGRFRAELHRVERYTTRLGRLLDLARDTAGDHEPGEPQ